MVPDLPRATYPRLGPLLALAMALVCPSTTLAAGLQVVTTTGNLGALARAMGGGNVRVTVLAPPDRDPRTLEARPAMVQALGGADLLVALGSGIEDDWLPAAIQAASPRHDLSPGQQRRLDATAMPVRNRPAATDASQPQSALQARLDLDPVQMGEIGRAISQRLAELDPAHASSYGQHADAFAAKLFARLPQWKRQTQGSIGVVLYCRDPIPLLERFDVPVLAILEPAPGVAPGGAELSDLIERMQGNQGLILSPTYADPKAPKLLAYRLAWPTITLPIDPAPNADGDAYLDHIALWLDTLTSVKPQPREAEPPATGAGMAGGRASSGGSADATGEV